MLGCLQSNLLYEVLGYWLVITGVIGFIGVGVDKASPRQGVEGFRSSTLHHRASWRIAGSRSREPSIPPPLPRSPGASAACAPLAGASTSGTAGTCTRYGINISYGIFCDDYRVRWEG